jgi:hypothetical protein
MNKRIRAFEDALFHWILAKVGDQALERFPKARGYTGHMYVVDKHRLLIARLKYS